jgi:hypothetical protein
MSETGLAHDEMKAIEPLVGYASPLLEAAEGMMVASRTMLAAASALSAGTGLAGARVRELTAEAVEVGVVRALRRESLLGGMASASPGAATTLLGLPGPQIPGTGYGRMGASITGHGARSQLYGSIGGAIGYAVGGPVGAVLGGMLGGWLGGGDDDEAERARQQEELRRQWLNTPEGFEIEAYLYNLARNYRMIGALVPAISSPQLPVGGRGGRAQISPVIVNLSAGAVQINGSGAEAGEQAARAFAGALGRVLRLNSVVVPAPGFGEV